MTAEKINFLSYRRTDKVCQTLASLLKTERRKGKENLGTKKVCENNLQNDLLSGKYCTEREREREMAGWVGHTKIRGVPVSLRIFISAATFLKSMNVLFTVFSSCH